MAVDSAEEEGHLHGDQRGVASAGGVGRVGEVGDSSKVGEVSGMRCEVSRCDSRGLESKSPRRVNEVCRV